MKTSDDSRPTVATSAGALAKNKREGGANGDWSLKAGAPRRSRTTSRPQRETTFATKAKDRSSRAAATLIPPNREGQATPSSPSKVVTPAFPDLGGYRQLRLLAEAFLDAQKQRQAQENRFRHAAVSKGIVTKDGMFLHDAEIALERQREIEAIYEKAMLGSFRQVAPDLANFARNTRSVGEHTVARLLGVIGHPAIAEPYHWQEGKKPKGHVCNGHCGKTKDGKRNHLVADPPYLRSVAQLRSYCRVGDASRKRQKGMKQQDALASGNSRARMILYLLAVAQEKSGGKREAGAYRLLYEEAKAGFAERHPDASKKHCQNHALRIVGKEILKDLWIVARKSLGLPTAVPMNEEKTG